MIPRTTSANTLEDLSARFPLVSITGPRQSGKTTLARHVFKDKTYVTLEEPEIHEQLTNDLKGFLAQYPDGAVIDEAHRCPDIYLNLKSLVNDDERKGLFVLVGSQWNTLNTDRYPSAEGKVASMTLLPLTLAELGSASCLPESLDACLYTGGYPSLHDGHAPASQWQSSYVQTFLERDIHQIITVNNPVQFQRFLRVCACNVGELINLTRLADSCGITQHTAKAWLAALESSYLIRRLQPWHRHCGKRSIKTPKLYFYDTGLLCWLLGIRSIDQVSHHAQRGALFKNFVLSETCKQLCNRGEYPSVWFWRDRRGHEVDLIIERNNQFLALDMKSSSTIGAAHFKGLRYWNDLTDNEGQAVLVYGGDQSYQNNGVIVLPWRKKCYQRSDSLF